MKASSIRVDLNIEILSLFNFRRRIEMNDKLKDSALKTALGQLEKKYGAGTIMRLGD
jgi:hypothetical protein